MGIKQWLILIPLILIGCGGWSYHYYGMDSDVDYDHGKLLGQTASQDVEFEQCRPSKANPHPCVVMFSNEFYVLKQDYEDTKQKLKECQKRLQSLESK